MCLFDILIAFLFEIFPGVRLLDQMLFQFFSCLRSLHAVFHSDYTKLTIPLTAQEFLILLILTCMWDVKGQSSMEEQNGGYQRLRCVGWTGVGDWSTGTGSVLDKNQFYYAIAQKRDYINSFVLCISKLLKEKIFNIFLTKKQ